MEMPIIIITLAIEIALLIVYRFSPQKEIDKVIELSMATRLAKGSTRKLKRVYYG